jgi:Tfp pilus assembly protein PilW
MSQRGFTIIEFLIYCGLLLIFLYIMTGIFTQILDMQLVSQSTSPLTQDSRYIFSRLAYDISRAGSIVTPSTIGGEASTLGLTIAGFPYTYALEGTTLTTMDPTGSRALNSYATQVSNVSFRRYGNTGGKPSIRVILTLTGVASASSGIRTQEFSATIGQY